MTVHPATSATRLGRLQQQLHRQELKLARLKTKQNKKRQADTRLKLRLGGLLILVGWQDEPISEIENRLSRTTALLSSSDNLESLKVAGNKALKHLGERYQQSENLMPRSAEQRREQHRQLIALGSLLIKSDLQKIDYATLFGALIQMNKHPAHQHTSGESESSTD